MKKICVISSVHNALDNRVFYREAKSLVKLGYQVTLIAVHDRDEHKEGIDIIALPRVSRWRRPFVWLSLLNKAIRTRADAYHFHDPELLLVAPILRLATRKPPVYDIHEAYPDFIRVKDYLPSWVRIPLAWAFGWIEPFLAGLQSGLIFADDEIARSFQNINVPKATLYNFPSREFVDEAQKEAIEYHRRPPLVLHLGGHERNRGTKLIAQSFKLVKQSVPDARLCLVGHFIPPNLREEVEKDLRDYGLQEAVEITGQVPFTDIGDYLREGAVGWVPWQPFPKNQKNIPTKLFEYMAYGIPIVSSHLPSTQPFVHPGDNGFLVKAADPGEHARAIVRLLENPAEAAALGRKGQELVRDKYNWGPMEARLGQFYQQILKQSN